MIHDAKKRKKNYKNAFQIYENKIDVHYAFSFATCLYVYI